MKKIISYKYSGWNPASEEGVYRVEVYEVHPSGYMTPSTITKATAIKKLQALIEDADDKGEARVWKKILKEVQEYGEIPFSVLA